MAPEVDSDDENAEYEDDSGHRYRLYLDELEDGNMAPSGSASLQGKLNLTSSFAIFLQIFFHANSLLYLI